MKSSTLVVLFAAFAFAAPSIAVAQSTTDGSTDAATETGENTSCEELGSAASIESMGMVDMNAVAAATNVSVVPVADCDDTTRSALATAGGTTIAEALKANAAVDTAITAQGATMADVIGATVSGDTITVYVESDADSN